MRNKNQFCEAYWCAGLDFMALFLDEGKGISRLCVLGQPKTL